MAGLPIFKKGGLMNIETIKTSRVKPYKDNPRLNDGAVVPVMNSIKRFGFQQPIVLDGDGVVIVGHTRLEAAKRLGLESVPCVIAKELSPAQAKAYRLADNKVGELARWDLDKLGLELGGVPLEFNMKDFGFDFEGFAQKALEAPLEPEEVKGVQDHSQEVQGGTEGLLGGYYGDARERTALIYRLWDFDEGRSDGKYQMPTLTAETYVPRNGFIGFNYLLSTLEKDKGVHFYIDDYQFERIWVNPPKYIERIAEHDCAMTPDFSLYLNMPTAMKIWNIYRSRLIGQLMQDAGIRVIPTLSWAEPESFEYCFDGIEPGGTVSVSTIGVKRGEEATKIWTAGMDEAMRRLRPSAVVIYGGDIGYDFGEGVEVVYVVNEVAQRWKEREQGE